MGADAGAAAECLRGRVGEIGDVIDPQTRAQFTDVEPIALSDHVMNSAIGNRPQGVRDRTVRRVIEIDGPQIDDGNTGAR